MVVTAVYLVAFGALVFFPFDASLSDGVVRSLFGFFYCCLCLVLLTFYTSGFVIPGVLGVLLFYGILYLALLSFACRFRCG